MVTKPTIDDTGMVRIVVYGTLKQGHCNHLLLTESDAQLLGKDTITGRYFLSSMGGLPGLFDSDDSDDDFTVIKGEVWGGDEEMLAAVDMLEGHPRFYQRRKVWSDLLKKRVWVYFLHDTWEGIAQDVVTDGLWNPTDAEKTFWNAWEKADESASDNAAAG